MYLVVKYFFYMFHECVSLGLADEVPFMCQGPDPKFCWIGLFSAKPPGVHVFILMSTADQPYRFTQFSVWTCQNAIISLQRKSLLLAGAFFSPSMANLCSSAEFWLHYFQDKRVG